MGRKLPEEWTLTLPVSHLPEGSEQAILKHRLIHSGNNVTAATCEVSGKSFRESVWPWFSPSWYKKHISIHCWGGLLATPSASLRLEAARLFLSIYRIMGNYGNRTKEQKRELPASIIRMGQTIVGIWHLVIW